MCTFGDVKQFSSRAFLDDDDDFDEEMEPRAVEVQLTGELEPASVLLLLCGGLAVEFGHRMLQRKSLKSIGVITATSDEARETLAELHALDGLLLVLCPESRSSDSANSLAQQVLSLCSSACSCAVVTSEHVSKLRAATGDGDCSDAVRCLTSPAATHLSPSVRRLPQPAFVDAVPAAVLTACTLQSLSCVVYVAYTESFCAGDAAGVEARLLRALQSHLSLRPWALPAPQRPTAAPLPPKTRTIHVPDNYI